MFCHTKIFLNNNTEIEYASFGTYLCLLFHIVAFDIKALVHVPWHQFVCMFIPCGRLANQPTFFSVYQQGAPSFLETGKSPTVLGPDCMEDARRCPNGIAHAARLVSARQYADVHCRATEQFHARACLFSSSGQPNEDVQG